jgi:hypothetical protein
MAIPVPDDWDRRRVAVVKTKEIDLIMTIDYTVAATSEVAAFV